MKTITENPQPDLAVATREPLAIAPAARLTSLDILESAVRGGITSENVAVVKEIIAMRREEINEAAKAEFAKAFFKLKKSIAETSLYADKSATNKDNKVAYTYCSETEISDKLEPVLFANGFAMLFGQRKDEGGVVAIITLIHEAGHQETREYAVRAGSTNAMKDATAADAGSTTTAWRHLVIKMFGLKSRISESDDARNLGDTATKVTKAQSDELEHRLKMINGKVPDFLTLAGAKSFSDIPAAVYPILDRFLTKREGRPA
jgi:hypothetical protein